MAATFSGESRWFASPPGPLVMVRGGMQAALQRDLFLGAGRGEGAASASHLAVVLTMAAEIAGAMAYLHSNHIVHGDLSTSNVLLTSCPTAPHGFTAKISDFGLSR